MNRLPEGRVKYTSIIKGRTFPGDSEPTYGLGMLYEKDGDDLKDFMVEVKNCIDEKFSSLSDRKRAEIFDNVFKDCDEMEKYEEDESTRGKFILSFRVFDPPLLPLRNDELRSSIEEKDDKEFYPGCWAIPVVDLWARTGPKHKNNPGVTLVLKAVLKTRDDDRIGSVFNQRAAFDDVKPAEFTPPKSVNKAMESFL